ncbi:SCO family protein [Lysobacter terrae]
MSRRFLCLSIALLSLAWATLAAAAEPAPLKAGVFDPPAAAPELSLQASTGGTLSLAHYRGRVVLLEFGFTNCPKVCPTTLATLAQVRKRLGADARDLQVVFVTVDPERDNAQQMRAYLHGFDPSFVGGTGTPAQLAEVRKHYGVMAQRKNVGDSYTVGHSSSVFLIDRKGRLRGMMPYGQPPADYLHDVRALLAE